MLEDLMYRCEKVVRTNYRRPTQATPVICFSSFSFRISKTNYPEVEPGLTVFYKGFCMKVEQKNAVARRHKNQILQDDLSCELQGRNLVGPILYELGVIKLLKRSTLSLIY